jgi:ribonuclease PH
MVRQDGRKFHQLREINLELDYVDYPEGSVLISMGNTRVLCNVSVEEHVPSWMADRDQSGGWITAEYGMLPRSTHTRRGRETKGLSGRTQEIRRLIGRSLRAGIDLSKLGPRTCIVDCDVIQADGGTRTAAITGGYIALRIAVRQLIDAGIIGEDLIVSPVAAISVGMISGEYLLDLCYQEDAGADLDFNIVKNGHGKYIEIQGTAEGKTFSKDDLDHLLQLADRGLAELFDIQDQILNNLPD